MKKELLALLEEYLEDWISNREKAEFIMWLLIISAGITTLFIKFDGEEPSFPSFFAWLKTKT